MDFMGYPFFDNHTHSLNERAKDLTPFGLASYFYHGSKDILDPETAQATGYTPQLQTHIMNTSVFHALTEALAEFYGCGHTVDDVILERNQRTAGGVRPYARSLYEDAHIVGSVLDSDRPIGQEIIDDMPCKVHRLYQMDNSIFRLIKVCETYPVFKKAVLDGVVDGVTNGGFSGVKSHLSELYTNEISPVSDAVGERAYAAAKSGEGAAMQTVYCAMLTAVMPLCKELNTNIHIHTGVTGMSAIDGEPNVNGVLKYGQPAASDPMLLAPFLRHPDFRQTKVVLLHGGYPWMRSLAMMAYLYPNVYADFSVTLPFAAFALDQFFEEVLAYAPNTKIILGTGQLGVPETAWLGARLAKQSLGRVMEKAVGKRLISAAQAETTARQVLYQNALTLFGA